MAIQFACAHCNTRIQAPDSLGGKRARCPACGSAAEVPLITPDVPDPNQFARFQTLPSSHPNYSAPIPDTFAPRGSANPADGLPDSYVRSAAQLAGHKKVQRTRTQVVAMACGFAVVTLYALLGLLIGMMLLTSGTKNLTPEQAIVYLILGPPFIVAAFVAFFAPTIIAYVREHQNSVPIFIINAVFGGIFIGWVVSIAWAFSDNVRTSRQYIRQVIVHEDAMGPPV